MFDHHRVSQCAWFFHTWRAWGTFVAIVDPLVEFSLVIHCFAKLHSLDAYSFCQSWPVTWLITSLGEAHHFLGASFGILVTCATNFMCCFKAKHRFWWFPGPVQAHHVLGILALARDRAAFCLFFLGGAFLRAKPPLIMFRRIRVCQGTVCVAIVNPWRSLGVTTIHVIHAIHVNAYKLFTGKGLLFAVVQPILRVRKKGIVTRWGPK